jgi:hypothetical protein
MKVHHTLEIRRTDSWEAGTERTHQRIGAARPPGTLEQGIKVCRNDARATKGIPGDLEDILMRSRSAARRFQDFCNDFSDDAGGLGTIRIWIDEALFEQSQRSIPFHATPGIDLCDIGKRVGSSGTCLPEPFIDSSDQLGEGRKPHSLRYAGSNDENHVPRELGTDQFIWDIRSGITEPHGDNVRSAQYRFDIPWKSKRYHLVRSAGRSGRRLAIGPASVIGDGSPKRAVDADDFVEIASLAAVAPAGVESLARPLDQQPKRSRFHVEPGLPLEAVTRY